MLKVSAINPGNCCTLESHNGNTYLRLREACLPGMLLDLKRFEIVSTLDEVAAVSPEVKKSINIVGTEERPSKIANNAAEWVIAEKEKGNKVFLRGGYFELEPNRATLYSVKSFDYAFLPAPGFPKEDKPIMLAEGQEALAWWKIGLVAAGAVGVIAILARL